ncbi:MAG: leucyl aminopeptidase family protein [Alphaproteobacteria bacterium]|nr:leucyl aminopeptidase family protein [Alphaproteobacteria bacterium]
MLDCFAARPNAQTVTLTPVTPESLQRWIGKQSRERAAWIKASGYRADPGSVLLIPGKGKQGAVGCALVGIATQNDLWSWAASASQLPAGRFRLEDSVGKVIATKAAMGWAFGSYEFTRYKKPSNGISQLVWPKSADRAFVEGAASATYLVRDLINTPSSDMGPAELADASRKLAREFKARCKITVGDHLLRDNYPMIHAVGRASTRPPRLIDLSWGKAKDPKVTLIGKGVCFDSGGLDLKGASGMLLMKKDMGGAAHVLGLARMIMMAKLPVRLRVLVAAVENSVSGDAFRPMDILPSRAGKTVEIGNTDAEGRLVLADALTEALSEKPALMLDFATLTGAARVALGPELPAMFCNDDSLADAFARCGVAENDPVWRMPLWRPYRRYLDSEIADINNTSTVPQGGAVTAALFLHEFVGDTVPWAHFDVYGWNAMARPGRMKGGEAMAIRTAFRVIEKRFS